MDKHERLGSFSTYQGRR